MEKLLATSVPHPCPYFFWVVAAAITVRLYVSAIEAWSRGRDWFWPVLLGAEKRLRRMVPSWPLTDLLVYSLGFLKVASTPYFSRRTCQSTWVRGLPSRQRIVGGTRGRTVRVARRVAEAIVQREVPLSRWRTD
jgi:hypothetical protein